MYPPLIFIKKWINWRHGGDVSDDVTTTKAINVSMVRCFCVLILLCQQVTHNKTFWEGKPV